MLLAPAENALRHGTAGLGDRVAGVAGRALVDRACAALSGLGQCVVLSDVRGDVHLAQCRDVIAGVICFVLADRDALGPFGFCLEHRLRGAPLRRAAGLSDATRDRKTVAVLHERMPHVAESGLAPVRLAIELCVRIACALMRVVFALLTVKVTTVAVIRTIFRLETFVRGPGFDASTEKCSSDSKGLTLGWFKSLSMNFPNTSPR